MRKASGSLSGLPKAGVWRYASGGDEKIGLGPVSVARGLPTRSLLVVLPLKAGERSVELQISADHAEAWHVAPTDRGLVGSFREVRVGTVGYTRSIAGKTTPAVVLVPRKLHVGLVWKQRYAVTGIVFQRDSRVVAKKTVDVGGVPLPTWVIATTETLTGAVHGKDVYKEWWSPDLGLSARIEWNRDFSGSVINVVTDTLTLESPTRLR